jgi:hypothetical protein
LFAISRRFQTLEENILAQGESQYPCR